ncbi:hypothetical protein BOTU111921_24745 [Bordetella tumbae]|uniref:ankyrin repeat domain-containing protein n=1 Tax=Bordetella tumbae TaxID=1649139 RepID=UPI0039F13493
MQVNQSPSNGAAASANVQHVVADRDSTQRPFSNEIFFDAIAAGDLGAVKDLLQHPEVDLRSINTAGQTPLHVAIEMGHAQIFDALLLRCGDDPRIINTPDRLGYTPLMSADKAQGIAMMKVLAAAGANPSKLLVNAMSRGWKEMADELIASGADVSEAFERAVRRNLMDVATVLLVCGADGIGELTSAIDRGEMHAVRRLLDIGVDPSELLEQAADVGDLKTMKTLLSNGANAFDVLMDLARDNNVRAVAVLIGEGGDHVLRALQALAKKPEDDDAFQTMLEAGEMVLCGHVPSSPDGYDRYKNAISALLIEVADAGNLAQTRSLIDANADSTFAVRNAMSLNRIPMAALLMIAGADFAELKPHFNGNGSGPTYTKIRSFVDLVKTKVSEVAPYVDVDDDRVIGASLLAKRRYEALSNMGDIPESSWKTAANALAASGFHRSAELWLAVERGDWPAIKRLIADGTVDGTEALKNAVDETDVNAAILLVAAGVDITAVVNYALQSGRWRAVNTLVGAGLDVTEGLTRFIEQGYVREAINWIEICGLHDVEVCESLFENGLTDQLQMFVRAQPDEGRAALMQAASNGNIGLARALLGVGVDGAGTLGQALAGSQLLAADNLIRLNVDITLAMQSAMAEKRVVEPAIFSLLGANSSAT